MALFKINRGSKKNLPTTKTEGYMYITEDVGDIYIDISSTQRIRLNSESAEKIRKITYNADGSYKEEVSLDYDSIANGLMTSGEKSKLSNTNIAYGICSTGATTAAKVITISGNTQWILSAGAIIIVKFSYTNTAQNPTFNVNGTGAKSVWYGTSVLTTSNLSYAGYANRPMIFAFDGTQYVFMGWSYDAVNVYSNAILGQGYGTCATAEATVAKVVTLSSYSLSTGGIVAVKFTNAVPASATMNINNKGAKAIYYKGTAITAGVIKAGDIVTFIYDGTQYHLISIDRCQTDIATKLATPRAIDGVNFDGSANITHYGVCSTAASTAAKTVSIPGFQLVEGAFVIIRFTAANSASNPTLNVNDTGAYPIYRYGTTAVSTGTTTTGWYAGSVQMLTYTGSAWIRDYWNNTTYSPAALGQGYGICDTAEATVAKVVTLSNYSLTTGGIVAVKFTNAVPASATMNINSKGAKNIYYKGAAITAGAIKAGDIATFVYDGTQYDLLSIDNYSPYFTVIYGTTPYTKVKEAILNNRIAICDKDGVLFFANSLASPGTENECIIMAAGGTIFDEIHYIFIRPDDSYSTPVGSISECNTAKYYNGTTSLNSSSDTKGYYRPIRVSTSAPTSSDGNIGDIWIQYST